MSKTASSRLKETEVLTKFKRAIDRVRVFAVTRPNFVAAILLTALSANLIWLSYSSGITQDEVIHIPAGQYQLQQRDFRMNNVTPPALKSLSALATIFVRPRPVLPPFPQDTNVDFETRDYQIAREFWTTNNDSFKTIVFTARLGAVVLTILLGLMIFVFTRQLFDVGVALLALALFIVEPNILAHGHIVHADVISALALVLFCYAVINYWRHKGSRWTLILGAATGLALIAKFTLIALFVVFIIALVARWNRARGRLLRDLLAKSGAIIICVVIVNAAYFFEPRNPATAQTEIANLPRAGALINAFPQTLTRASGILLPTDFVQGFSRLARANQQGHDEFLLGKYSRTGWWYYFPVAFLLKTTIPFLLLSLASGAWAITRLFLNRSWRIAVLVVPIACYAALLATNRMQIGVRHLLPLFPFLFILCAVFLDWFITQRRRAGAACALIIIAASSFEAVRAWPTYMSYMNQLTMRHPRWSYLGDSNIEWGQDIPALAAYLNARGVTRIRGAMLCGEVAMPRYGIDYTNLLSGGGDNDPPTEFIAIGANFLNGSLIPGNRNWFEAYRERRPEAVFGDSIYLYRLRDGP